jgi:pimeloyl-ACP methyl ester carboxylesterase
MPQSLNKYSYVLNNPITYIDLSGHFAACFQGGIGAQVVQTSPIPRMCEQLKGEGLVGSGYEAYASSQVQKAFDEILKQLAKNPDEVIIIIAYSWSASAALRLARMLNDVGITVDVLILIDPVIPEILNTDLYEYNSATQYAMGGPTRCSCIQIPPNVDNALILYAAEGGERLDASGQFIDATGSYEGDPNNNMSALTGNYGSNATTAWLTTANQEIQGSDVVSVNEDHGGIATSDTTYRIISTFISTGSTGKSIRAE